MRDDSICPLFRETRKDVNCAVMYVIGEVLAGLIMKSVGTLPMPSTFTTMSSCHNRFRNRNLAKGGNTNEEVKNFCSSTKICAYTTV